MAPSQDNYIRVSNNKLINQNNVSLRQVVSLIKKKKRDQNETKQKNLEPEIHVWKEIQYGPELVTLFFHGRFQQKQK